jgi:hypothetical protein
MFSRETEGPVLESKRYGELVKEPRKVEKSGS